MFGATFGGVVQSGSDDCYTAAFCWFDGAVQAYDAISQTIATNIGDSYLISFDLADNSFCRTSGGQPCNFSDLSTNGNSTNTGGNGINLTVYAQAGIPVRGDTPEPSTLLMFGSGLLTVGGMVRRRLSL